MSLSKIVVSGRVIRTPEKRFTPNTNIAICEFAIAVESVKQDGSVESNPVRVLVKGNLAERVSQDIVKGDYVAVDGRLQINNSVAEDGQRKREAEVDASFVENITKTLGSNQSSPEEFSQPAKVGSATLARKSSPAGKADELDAIFANEDEIPF